MRALNEDETGYTMSMRNRLIRWFFWPVAGSLVLGLTWALWLYSTPRRPGTTVNAAVKKDFEVKVPKNEDDDPSPQPETPVVKVLLPRSGAMDRITEQVGTVQAFESVYLHAKVSGYLKTQTVDIGDRVKRGKVLAVVDVPELEKQVERNAALVELAKARVAQMKAKVSIAKADVEAAKAQITYAEANAKSATAWVTYRRMQFQRMKELAATKSIDLRLEDEYKEHLESAKESENAKQSAIITAKAQALSAEAKIALAEADVGEAQAQVKVAQAEQEKTQVQLAYATIYAPFDGIITNRTLFPGDFVRSAGEGAAQLALLTIQRTDRMRVIVHIPDREVRYADPGDPVVFELDAFPGEKFQGKISRIAASEDARTRMMPAEIDLENKDGRIRQGMYGRATIYLEKAIKSLSIPSACLVGKAEGSRGVVYVVRDGKSWRTPITIGLENRPRIEVLDGLKIDDQVIYHPPTALTDGAEVEATVTDENESKNGAEQP